MPVLCHCCENRALATVLCTFCQPHLPKVLPLQSRTHFAAALIFQNCSDHFGFLRFSHYSLMLPLQPGAHSADVIFQKRSERDTFLTFSSANRDLATVLCAFCRQLCQIEPRNCRNQDPPSATARATLPEETQGFAPMSVLTPDFTRSRAVTPLLLPRANCPCSLCCWHDDADMKMTWCQGCPWTFVCNSEDFKLNFLWQIERPLDRQIT